uniref:Desumoylating isopeptidase n=1 Tax=Anoplophora glabripennis TaxID=217634 RepID=V5GPH0_ANOGL
MTSQVVELYIYDLSRGMAAAVSPMLIGKKIDGIWHTSIVVYNREYFFGSRGVESCNPGATLIGPPLKAQVLGETQVPYSVFIDYVNGLSESTYAGSTYNLFKHNCNNFSQDIAQFLCGVSIPKYILELPNEVLNTSLGAALPALVAQLEKSARPIAEEQERFSHREQSPDFEQLNSQIEEARYNSFLLAQRRKTLREKLAKKERKKEKKRKKILKEGGIVPAELREDLAMADIETVNGEEAQLPSDQALALEEEERREEEEKKKARDPPIVYKELIDVKAEFDALIGLIDGKLSPEEQRSTEELHQYMLGDEGSWALSDGFLDFVGRLLNDRDLPVDVRVRLINILAMAALKDDVILVLHQDRKDHVLMNYAYEIDRLTPQEQEAIALFMVNMFENLSSSEWLLYISEWTYSNQQTSNIRVTTKVAVHSLLSDLPVLQERGSAIIHNLACKEVKTVVFDDIAVELTMALLQYFNSKPSEEQLFRCMKALAKFVQVSTQEVPQLIQMIGPDPNSFKGTSERIDVLIDQISTKLR